MNDFTVGVMIYDERKVLSGFSEALMMVRCCYYIHGSYRCKLMYSISITIVIKSPSTSYLIMQDDVP